MGLNAFFSTLRRRQRPTETQALAAIEQRLYVGHLLFMLGLALTFRSWPALALLVFHVVWFNRRVIDDEVRLEAKFGAEYLAYKARVKRWIPGVL